MARPTDAGSAAPTVNSAALALSPFVSQKLGTFVASENAADLIVLRDLIEAGKLAPAVDRIYSLSEVPAALRYLLDGHAQGKIVISPVSMPPRP